MLRLSRFIMQFGLLPPININFNFPQWQRKPLAEVNIPKRKPSFDPTKKITPLQARVLAASNGLTGAEKP